MTRYLSGPSDASVTADLVATQREAFISAYETRTRAESVFTIARKLDLPREVVIRWLQDPDFQARLAASDSWRIAVVRDIFSRHLDAICENLAEIAKERWPHSVRAAISIRDFMAGTARDGEHRLRAIAVGQLNVFGGRPTDDQVTKILAEKRKHDRIISRYLKGREVEVAEEKEPGPAGSRKRPSRRAPSRARRPGHPPAGDPPPGA